MDLFTQNFTPIIVAEIVICAHIAHRLAVKHHLRCVVRTGFEQQRVHIGIAGNTRSLGLDSLRAANLQTIRGCVRVERHILRLERGGTVAVLTENAAQGSSNHALAYIAARSRQHHWM